MFSRYKKAGDPPGKVTPVAPVAAVVAAPAAEPSDAKVQLQPRAGTVAPKLPAEAAAAEKDKKRKEKLGELKVELHKRLLDNLNLAALEHASETSLKSEIALITAEALEEMSVVLNKEDRTALHQELYDEVMGLGPLEPLLKDDTVNDILVNGPHRIFVERDGKLTLTDITFKDERHLLRIIDKIVSAVGRRVDESNPYVDARLADGSRFNAMVSPVAVDGSLVSIRKFKKDKLGIQDLVKFGAFTEEMAAYLQAAVAVGVVVGAAAAGRWIALHHASRVLPAGILLGLMMPIVAQVAEVWIALLLLAFVGMVGGLLVVPLNALLQHRGFTLLSAGRSVAVQGFNENLSVLCMLGLYAALVAAEVPIVPLMTLFGGCIAMAMAVLTRVAYRSTTVSRTPPHPRR